MRKQKWGQRGQERLPRGSHSEAGTRQGGMDTQMCAGTDRRVLGQTRCGPCEIKPIPGHEHPDDSGHSCHSFVSSNVGMQLTAHPCHHGLMGGGLSSPGGFISLPYEGKHQLRAVRGAGQSHSRVLSVRSWLTDRLKSPP